MVTGGAKGIGLATVRRLAESGARVAIWDRVAAVGTAAVRSLTDLGLDVIFVEVDVTDGDAVQAAKLLAQGAKENDAFVLTNGIVAQMKVDGSGIEAIGKLPSQEELRAKTVGAIQGPLAGFVFTLRGALTAFAGTIQAKIDKESAAA